ncbi:MAG: KTSC domain-containing protein [Flavobacteriales bacterium]|jgi:hypothetical protein|nr:KTSC domain-containing protein [Flavobacteriales bacterium]MBK6883318.1 KTSC domain-containing protein [Flavobacteriales bacterium]MBK7113938.1 KTSC domain-containing protein [Flavobacteriales bacterium]MBK7620673.1 KTSC domain-containing protein [Flavobacteriales bacterium]MBK8531252.1 KTSC domain-containing protein [Flavobacteriales bacterium]
MKAALLALLFAVALGTQAQECYDLSARSSWVGVVCFNDGTLTMQMQGATYKFCNVPFDTFSGLVNAGSPGTYYDQYIRGRYRCSGY